MFLIVGLGNPGPKYAGNRHNIGFMVVDHLAGRWSAPSFREKWKAEFARCSVGGEDVVLLKPMTYMNLSGESVQGAMTFFKVDLSDVVVVHDELDLPFGTLRVKVGGGAAGHNGLKSIMQHCGGDFVRLRMGINKPRSGPGHGHVLSDFSKEEQAELPDLLSLAEKMVTTVVSEGPRAAMNAFHAKKKPSGAEKPEA